MSEREMPERVIITPLQKNEMEILRRGGDPGQEILPPDWVGPEPDESEEAPQSGRRFADLL